ncbi:MAG: hypothetical protein FJ044_03165 [Candidatus Cloacimonetes bacterium]|nr:hypothetical protein [Candidatus Cloacimonadota bacterium]
MERKESLAQFKISLGRLRKLVQVGKGILAEHGSTRGELEAAGVYDDLQDLESRAGQLYRDILPHANFLIGGDEGVEKIKKQITEAILAIDFLGPLAMQELIDELKRGWALDAEFYPIVQLERMLAMLEVVEQNV